jgi:ParB-like chromosome segregation protein Spo0J
MTPTAHAYADLFPLLSADALSELAADIKANGLHQPVVLYQGKVLDGRNRLKACRQAGVEPRFINFTGTEEEALAFALSSNLHRRHLNSAQRAALAVQLLPHEREAARRRMMAGATHKVGEAKGEATALAGEKVGLSRESVRRAAKIGTDRPEVFKAMIDGTVRTLGEAQRLAQLGEDQRAKALDTMRRDGVRLRRLEGATPWMYRSTGEVEWYSPTNVLDAARAVLGGSRRP